VEDYSRPHELEPSGRRQALRGVLRLGAILLLGFGSPGAEPVPPVAARFLGLFSQLRAAEAAHGTAAQPHVQFQLSDAEINDYMKYALRTTPRPGLDSVAVKIFPQNYISTLTVVDFDAVERWKPGTIPGVFRPVLNGRKTVWVDYRFRTENARITFSVEKAYYENVRLPAFLVEKMIEIVAARQPEKYDATKPLPLPFGLRRLWTGGHTISGEN
jgi:hypothetical protein